MMISLSELSTIQFILPGALLLLLCIQLFYYLYFYIQPLYRINAEKKQKIHYNTTQPGVSVVIYANNDSEQLAANLPSFLEQNYPDYEVIVVNDGSSDESEEVLSAFENKYTHLYHTFLAEGARNLSRKKLSLTLGIKAARHEIILLTNANCRPASENWIHSMSRNFTDKTDIVLGYTRFEQKKGFGERFIAFDLLLHALRYLGYALSRKPYKGEGSNLAYRKSLFFEHKGFAKYMHLHLGDDDLFINQVATRRNTKVELSEAATMISYFKNNKEGWRFFKRNSTFTASFYKTPAKMIYGAETCSRYLFYITATASIILFRGHLLPLAITSAIILAKWILQGIFWYQAGKKLGTRKPVVCVPVFELIDPVMNLFFKISSYFHRKRNYTWRL
ncbi:MAG: glycosyltransferase [Bacteroidales bacterium]